MKKLALRSKINNTYVKGLGHLQPGDNPWIGVFIVSRDLLATDPDEWRSTTIEYTGPFNYRGKTVHGKGTGTITHIRENTEEKNVVIINVEGIGKPELENPLDKSIRFSYNSNLPPYLNARRTSK